MVIRRDATGIDGQGEGHILQQHLNDKSGDHKLRRRAHIASPSPVLISISSLTVRFSSFAIIPPFFTHSPVLSIRFTGALIRERKEKEKC
jgi:hypothetical protein